MKSISTLFRQLFLIVVLISAFSLSAWGEEVTVSLAKGKHANSQITWTENNFIVEQTRGNVATAVNSSYISAPRVYKGHILSFTANSGYKITKISITYNSTYKGNTIVVGTDISNNKVVTDSNIFSTISSSSGGTHTFTPTNGVECIHIQNLATENNVQLRPTTIKVTIVEDNESEPTLVAPTFSVDSKSFTSPFTVTLSCETEGADIYYNTIAEDGEYSLYENEINISETTTIYAKSKLGETESEVASKTYTKLNISNTPTIADFLSADVSDDVWYTLTGVVSNITNTTYGNFDLTDETGTVYVYGLTKEKAESNNQSFASIGIENNDTLTLCGVRAVYNGKAQVGGPAYYISHKKYIAPTYTVTLYNGNTPINTIKASEFDLPTSLTPTNCQSNEWEFIGWVENNALGETTEKPTIHIGTYTPTKDIALYAVYKKEETIDNGEEAWKLTDITNISAADEVVITMKKSDGKIYALTNDKGASNAPTPPSISVNNNKITNTIEDNIKWNISNSNNTLTIYPNGLTSKWLYCTNANNGVRVGTNENKTFEIDATTGYLKHIGTSRYLGVYNSQDWRCYTNTTGNIANQTLGFYVKTGGIQTTITYNSNPTCVVKEALTTPILSSPNVGKYEFTISWDAIDNADKYIIKINDEQKATISETSYTATDLTPNTTYSCKVIATNIAEEFYDSEEGTIDITTLSPDKYTITWNTNGEIKTTEYEESSTLELPTPGVESTAYCTFVGWYTEQTSGSNLNPSQSPIGEKVTSATKPIGDVTYYAVYDNSGPEEKVTSNLTDGTYYIRTEDGIYYTGKNTEKNIGDYSSSVEDAAEIIVTTSGANFAIFDGTYWLSSPNSNNITFNDALITDWSLTNEGKINSITLSSRFLQYNSNSGQERFACYTGTQKDAYLYRKGVSATGYFSTIISAKEVNNKVTFEHATKLYSLTIYSNATTTGEVITEADINVDVVTLVKTIGQTWCFFSLPYDCNVADVVATASDTTLTYAPNENDGSYVIAEYNGGWVELLGTSHTLNANQGYIIGQFTDNTEVTVKFPSNGAQTISAPTTASVAKTSNNDFNLIGLPYYQKVNAELNVEYLSIPNEDGMTYNQTDDHSLLSNIAPFSSFFVETVNNIEFTIAAQQNAAPMMRANGVTNKAVVTLTDANGGVDKTTIINNPNNTTDYEIGHDLTKLIGYASIPQIYSHQGEKMLAFNSLAIDNSTVIPLGVYAHADGEYTFALNEKSMGDLQGWELYDNETGKTTRLANEALTVNLAQGTHEGRFEIRLQQRISTDCDNSMGDMTTWITNGTLNINNMPADAVVYIYDAVGRMIYVATPNANTFNYSFVARGVYNIVVRSADNTVSFKTIY